MTLPDATARYDAQTQAMQGALGLVTRAAYDLLQHAGTAPVLTSRRRTRPSAVIHTHHGLYQVECDALILQGEPLDAGVSVTVRFEGDVHHRDCRTEEDVRALLEDAGMIAPEDGRDRHHIPVPQEDAA